MLKNVKVNDHLNDRWRNFHDRRALTIRPTPIFSLTDKIFAMGSCFAREIRFSLMAKNIDVGPDYASIQIDRSQNAIDDLPDDPHLNYYNSFTIVQEFRRIAGSWTQEPDDYWEVGYRRFGDKTAYQDPYKRTTFAKTPKELHSTIIRINNVIDTAARSADVFFFTFGMTEVFRKKDNGLIACQKPTYGGGGGLAETDLHLSSFAENLANLEELYEIIKGLNPKARVVVTVSPVPLSRTFSGRDILIANTEGKAILRAAVGEFSKSHDDVYYYPAFEIVTLRGESAFQQHDLRHVTDETVSVIMSSFVKAHLGTTGTR